MKTPIPSIARLAGYLPALPTPFRDGALDEPGFIRLCEWQIGQGAPALMVGGAIGEAPTLSPAEQERLVRLAVTSARGRVPVLAEAGANSTRHAIELGRRAVAAGADGLVSVVPYYNRPTQDGLLGHFTALHDAVDRPILLQDAPSRCCCTLAVDTIARLAELPRIVGLVDSSGDLSRPARLRRLLGHDFRLFSGDDLTALGFLAEGGDGCISAAATVAPRRFFQLYEAWHSGGGAEAEMTWELLSKLIQALAAESSPGPAKYALKLMDLMSEEMRLPLVPPAELLRHEIADALLRLDLIGQRGGRIAAAA